MDFIKIQKSRYLKNETFFLPIKKNCQLHIKGYFMAKNSFVAEVTFKQPSKSIKKHFKYLNWNRPIVLWLSTILFAGFPIVGEGGRASGSPLVGGTEGIPPLSGKFVCLPPFRLLTVLTQKWWLCNFHAVFGNFVQIDCPPTSRPHLAPTQPHPYLSYDFFQPVSHQNWCPHLKMKPPSNWKTNPPPSEAPCQEMIPRKKKKPKIGNCH